MEPLPRLPLGDDAIPESLRRFVGSSAPGPAKAMAARGLVPVQGPDLLFLLTTLAHDGDDGVRASATSTLEGLPDGVVVAAIQLTREPSVLDGIASVLGGRQPVLEAVVSNPATHGETVARIARGAPDRLAEMIALNQQRILTWPSILEALYKNKKVRMSTIDRLVEFVARHGVDVPGLPSFQAHAEALAGQLIAEPMEEALPGDQIFLDALAHDSSDANVMESDGDDDDPKEKVRDNFKPLAFRVREMSSAEKVRFAIVGDAAARALLVRDPKKVVFMAAITSPSMTDAEATSIAHSKEVSIDVLRYIGSRKEWLRSYDIKRALIFNPKVPMDVGMRFLAHLRPNDLKTLSQSRGVANQLKILAKQRLDLAEKKGKA